MLFVPAGVNDGDAFAPPDPMTLISVAPDGSAKREVTRAAATYALG